MKAYRRKYLQHHSTVQWQQSEIGFLKENLERGVAVGLPDFAENGIIQRKQAHQSTYWVEVGYTLYPCPMLFRAEDLHASVFGGEAEKQKVVDFFTNRNEKPIVTISLMVVSPDLKHDNSFVQHVHGKIIPKWVKENAIHENAINKIINCSDGGPAHYKLSDHVAFISTHESTTGIALDWDFKATGHGKDLPDSKGGSAIGKFDQYQLSADGGEIAKIFNARGVYEYLVESMTTPDQDIFQKKGRSVYSRVFFYIPISGEGSVNRRISKAEMNPSLALRKCILFMALVT